MTLERLKTLVLARLDELSSNGEEIPRGALHVSDYMRKIPGFVDLQLRVISSVLPKRKRFSIFHNPAVDRSALDHEDDGDVPVYETTVTYTMPDDFQYVIKVTRADGYNAEPYISWLDGKTLAIAYLAAGEYVIDYRAYPETVDETTPDDAALDVDEAAIPALIAGVAAMCVQHENEPVFLQLYRENQGLLANLRPAPRQMQPLVRNKMF